MVQSREAGFHVGGSLPMPSRALAEEARPPEAVFADSQKPMNTAAAAAAAD